MTGFNRRPQNNCDCGQVVQTDFQNCSDYPHVRCDRIVDCKLLCVDLDSPIQHIEQIDCQQMSNSTITQADTLCDLVHCACDMEDCLEHLYGSIDGIVHNKCCLTYTGPITAKHVYVDLENCRISYKDLTIPGCADFSF